VANTLHGELAVFRMLLPHRFGRLWHRVEEQVLQDGLRDDVRTLPMLAGMRPLIGCQGASAAGGVSP
jgi:hypothetical protein